MSQAGIPLFYLQGIGGGITRFRDLFNDSSIYWGWRTFLGLTPGTKAIVEQNGRIELRLPAVDGRWDNAVNEGVRFFMSPIGYPCEIIARLDVYPATAQTYAGLFISRNPCSFGANAYMAIERYETGIRVVNTANNTTPTSQTAITDLPIWFRIRLGCVGYGALHALFDYSLDGMNWINIWEQSAGSAIFPEFGGNVGFYARNVNPSYSATTSKWDHFRMKLKTIN